MPRKTHADRLFEMGAISKTVHSMLKTEEDRRKAAKAKDAAKIAADAIAKAMTPNADVTGLAPRKDNE